jgi:hypothetical protein
MEELNDKNSTKCDDLDKTDESQFLDENSEGQAGESEASDPENNLWEESSHRENTQADIASVEETEDTEEKKGAKSGREQIAEEAMEEDRRGGGGRGKGEER